MQRVTLTRPEPSPQVPPLWFLALLAAYAVLELSFNHQLMGVSSAALVDPAALRDLEVWARVISGLGLSLWLMRALLRRGLAPLLAVLLSVLVGIGLMWHLQRWLVETIVERGSEQDKQMSLYAGQLAPALLGGDVTVRGQRLLDAGELSPPALQAWQALLPATLVGLQPNELQVQEDQAWIGAATLSPQPLNDAYRRAVMVPIALGVSLLFGLANASLLVSLVLQRCAPRRIAATSGRPFALFLLLWLGLLSASWVALADEMQPRAYREITRPSLRAAQPLLWPFVEWSLRAQPAWQEPTRWLHETLLSNYGFRLPRPLADVSL
jgi:hypothetical protein